MDDHTKAVFDAYAAGVNAFIDGPDPLPVEYRITGVEAETLAGRGRASSSTKSATF